MSWLLEELGQCKERSALLFSMSEEVPAEGDEEVDAADDGIEDHEFNIDVSIPLGMGIDHPNEGAKHYPAMITVVAPDSQSDKKGVKVGMIIHTINGQPCRGEKLDHVMEWVKNAKKHCIIKL